jgi:hypothetical protein
MYSTPQPLFTSLSLPYLIEQQALVGQGYAGPPVDIGGVVLSADQVN